MTKITDPFNLAVDYTYDSLNRLDNITVEGKLFDYEFYPDGMLKAVNYPITPGGQTIRSEYTYDNINRLETVINQVGSQIISQYSYGYDSNGNITSVTENSSTTEYQYDDVNRLEGTTRPNGEEITYHYDTRGNRTNHIVNTTIPYNTIADTYGYNNWDELSQFATGETTYQYQYDPEGLRTKKESTSGTVRYHLDNNGRVIAESDASDLVTAQNIWGHKALARKVNGAYYYYLYNGHGDVVQVLDVNGIVVNSYSYDEWGNITSKTETIENPIRYAGEYYDEESGLYYLRARYYDPTTGRFISEDSNEGSITNPLSLNLYTYCINNPLIYIDPTGNECWLITEIGQIPGTVTECVHDTYTNTVPQTVRYLKSDEAKEAYKNTLIAIPAANLGVALEGAGPVMVSRYGKIIKFGSKGAGKATRDTLLESATNQKLKNAIDQIYRRKNRGWRTC